MSHSSSKERAVKLATEASLQVVRVDSPDVFIKNVLCLRKEIAKFETKEVCYN